MHEGVDCRHPNFGPPSLVFGLKELLPRERVVRPRNFDTQPGLRELENLARGTSTDFQINWHMLKGPREQAYDNQL